MYYLYLQSSRFISHLLHIILARAPAKPAWGPSSKLALPRQDVNGAGHLTLLYLFPAWLPVRFFEALYVLQLYRWLHYNPLPLDRSLANLEVWTACLRH